MVARAVSASLPMTLGGLGTQHAGTARTWRRGDIDERIGGKCPTMDPPHGPQTQNRHVGAQKGARHASWDAGATRKRPGPTAWHKARCTRVV